MTHYPFPTYQEETRYLWQYHCEGGDEGSRCDYKWVEQAVVKKSNYFLAGRPIATRITGDPVSGNNGLFYFLTDHLGSTTMLITAAGAAVAGTAAYYQPYGSGRTSPPTTLTERGYTGHHENRDIGLTYMNARYYIPGLGRFLTADTIVPAPANPQSHNRYSYVLGNPLVLVDPTGHYSCHTSGQNEHCVDATPPPAPTFPPPHPSIPSGPMITFSVIDDCTSAITGACHWSENEMNTIIASANATGLRLAQTLNAMHGWNLSAYN
ncbi:MAG: RHS repeat-associated core domain-containing protein [Anaerolineae bacterium]|nr:RHS repeat-associated core domain-containing protein [Anaerolineae bacterium]